MEDIIAANFGRMANALDEKNSVRVLAKLCRNANFSAAVLESDGVINEAQNAVYALKTMNKKISMTSHSRAIDNVLVYIFLKSLLTVPTSTDAFKLGLIDAEGNLKRVPKTEKENAAISNLDLFMAKMRKWLKPHLTKMSVMSWVRSVGGNDRIQNALSNAETVSKRAFVIRVNQELDKILRQK